MVSFKDEKANPILRVTFNNENNGLDGYEGVSKRDDTISLCGHTSSVSTVASPPPDNGDKLLKLINSDIVPQLALPKVGEKITIIPVYIINVETFYGIMCGTRNQASLQSLKERLNHPTMHPKYRSQSKVGEL